MHWRILGPDAMPRQTSDDFLFCKKNKQILEQIGQTLRLCKSKKSFQLQGALPLDPDYRYRFALRPPHVASKL